MAYLTNLQIQKLTYNEIGEKLISGELTEKRLKSYYTDARKKAQSNYNRVKKSEFKEIVNKETFEKVRNATVTTNALAHAVADVNKYLNSKKSTITGQKETREKLLAVADQMGFQVDESNYIKFRQFMDWFKNSKFAKIYDSDSPELPEAFEQGASPEDWQRLFEEFVERDRKNGEKQNS